MTRFFIQTVLTVLGNAVGIIVASILLSGFRLNLSGFIISVLFFSMTQILLAPFVLKMAIKYLPALRGGIALVTTLVVLIATTIFTDGLRISGFSTWFLASLVIWFATVLAGVFLPMLLFKKAVQNRRDSES